MVFWFFFPQIVGSFMLIPKMQEESIQENC